jgi:hypothetical protein
MLPRVANLQPDAFRSARLAFVQNAVVSSTGDVLVGGQSPLFIAASLFAITAGGILVWNPQVNGVAGDVSSVQLGIFTGPGATGTTIVANQSLTTTQVVGTTAVQGLTLTTAITTTYAGPVGWYINVGTALAGATINLSVFGQVLQN